MYCFLYHQIESLSLSLLPLLWLVLSPALPFALPPFCVCVGICSRGRVRVLVCVWHGQRGEGNTTIIAIQAVVTVPNDEQVEFGIGEWVTFKDVEGMTEINVGGPYKVVDTAMYNFKIDLDTTNFGKYQRKSMNKYGTVLEAKVPKTLDYQSLAECVLKPDFSNDPNQMGGVFDFDKFGCVDESI